MTAEEILKKDVNYYIANPQEMTLFVKENYNEVICSYCPKQLPAIIGGWYSRIERDRYKKPCDYFMKKGDLVDATMQDIPGVERKHYNNFNITNEIAEALIQAGYGNLVKRK